jgi:hypothetical protein
MPALMSAGRLREGPWERPALGSRASGVSPAPMMQRRAALHVPGRSLFRAGRWSTGFATLSLAPPAGDADGAPRTYGTVSWAGAVRRADAGTP